MVNILRIRDPEQWPVEVWDIGSVILKRRSLFYTEPIFSDEILKYNKWLWQHTDEMTIDEIVEVWAHEMFLVYLCYCDPKCDQALRHKVLLNLRKHYNHYLKQPAPVREKFCSTLRSIWDGRFLMEEGWWDGTA
jgi:hypothetical protein